MFVHISKKVLLVMGLLLAPLHGHAAELTDEQALHKGVKAFEAADIMGALPYLTQAANKGYPRAQRLLGYIMVRGEENKAAQGWYQKAARQGDVKAQLALAELAIEGKPGADISLEEGISWLRQAVEQGYPEAMVFQAGILENGGLGLSPDPAMASKLYHRAAQTGHGNAMLRLINAYEKGQLGLDKSAAQADYWRQRLEESAR